MNLKFFVKTIFLMVLFSPVACYSYPGETAADPLYIQKVDTYQDQMDRVDDLRNSLIEKYGSEVFYTCYQQNCAGGDMANPSTASFCLKTLEYPCISMLLREKAATKKTNKEVLNDGCHQKYGENSYFKENVNGTNICDCLDGYEWQGDVCIKKREILCLVGTEKVGDKCVDYCEYYFDKRSHAQLVGIFDFVCVCEDGYVFDMNKKVCLEKQVEAVGSEKIDSNKPSVVQPKKNNDSNLSGAEKQNAVGDSKDAGLNNGVPGKENSAVSNGENASTSIERGQGDDIANSLNVEKDDDLGVSEKTGLVKRIKVFMGRVLSKIAAWLLSEK